MELTYKQSHPISDFSFIGPYLINFEIMSLQLPIKILSIAIFLFLSLRTRGQEKTVQIHINHLAEGRPLSYSGVYTNEREQKYRFTRIEYFMSQFRLEFKDASTVLFDTIFLINGGKIAEFTLGSYSGGIPDSLSMYFGIDEARNHSDPSIYPVGHPLGPKLYTMHWDWASGYRFWAIEGKADTSDGNSFSVDFQYHIAADRNYFRMAVGAPVIEGDTIHYFLNMDYSEMMKAVDFKQNTFVHGGFGGPFDAPLDSMLERLKKGYVLRNGTERILSNRLIRSGAPRFYPVPTRDQLNIHLSETGHISTIQIFDLKGTLMLESGISPNSEEIQIPVNGLSAGIYQIQFLYTDRAATTDLILIAH